MVEALRDHGMPYRDAAKREGFNPYEYRFIRIPDDNQAGTHQREIEAILALSRIPEMDSKSHLLTNVTNTKGQPLRVLMIPRECPPLILSNRLEAPGDPEGDLYVVQVSQRGVNKRPLDIVVIVDNDDSAAHIAIRQASNLLGCDRRQLVAETMRVSREEFIKVSKGLMGKGVPLPGSIIGRFPELRDLTRRLRTNKDYHSF